MNLSDISESSFLPFSAEAEQAVLGAVLLSPECLNVVIDILPDGSFFYVEEHKVIYSAILSLFVSGEKIDYVTLLEKISAGREIEEKRCKTYLLDLAKTVPSVSNAEKYAQIIKEKFDVRTLMDSAHEILRDARSGGDADEILDSAEQKIFDIRSGKSRGGFIHIKEILLSNIERLDALALDESKLFTGLSTGFSDLDRAIIGLNKTDLILLAARPGMGKTSFALNIAENVAKNGYKVGFFSLEMSKEQLTNRIISSTAGISGRKVRTGQFSKEEWEQFTELCEKLSALGLYIDDTANITVPEMKARLRRLGGLDLVIIDYLQLVSCARSNPNRVQEISTITRHLKIMAKELEIPVICLSQLSRASEHRSEHRPILSDLRDSGSIEQDADVVMFLYREGYYSKDDPDVSNESECIISKNRHGETGSIIMHWHSEFTKFTAHSYDDFNCH
jgi:replicative DNA helicase